MAKTKTLTKAPALKTAGNSIETDFTFETINRATIRFNRAAVIYLEYNSKSGNVAVVVENEIAGTTKTLSGVVE